MYAIYILTLAPMHVAMNKITKPLVTHFSANLFLLLLSCYLQYQIVIQPLCIFP
jgi:hypothetical protein